MTKKILIFLGTFQIMLFIFGIYQILYLNPYLGTFNVVVNAFGLILNYKSYKNLN